MLFQVNLKQPQLNNRKINSDSMILSYPNNHLMKSLHQLNLLDLQKNDQIHESPKQMGTGQNYLCENT